MRIEEAREIFRIVSGIPSANYVCLNIGSSTRKFREETNPHINNILFDRMKEKGWKIIHSDIKHGDDIDLTGDVFDRTFLNKLISVNPSLTLCNNLLEHLEDYRLFARYVSDIIPQGGFLLVSVPFSYPYHPDPIDNGYRPSPKQLAGLFKEFQVEVSLIVQSDTYLTESIKKTCGVSLLKNFIMLFFPFYKPHLWRARLDRFRWMFSPYSTSVVLLKRARNI